MRKKKTIAKLSTLSHTTISTLQIHTKIKSIFPIAFVSDKKNVWLLKIEKLSVYLFLYRLGRFYAILCVTNKLKWKYIYYIRVHYYMLSSSIHWRFNYMNVAAAVAVVSQIELCLRGLSILSTPSSGCLTLADSTVHTWQC